MNWLCLVIGVALGGTGQRLWARQQRQQRDGGEENVLPSVPQTLERDSSGDPVELGDANAVASLESDEGRLEGAPLIGGGGTPEICNHDSLLWLAYVRALERAQFQGGFLARAAHELRSPLSSLMGLQQLILTDLCDSPEEERQCVAQSYEAAQNLHRLMDQLIRVAKLEQGSQRLDIQSIALGGLLEDVESLLYLQVADRNCRLHLVQPEKPLYAKGDYSSLRQVLLMLVEGLLAQKASEIRLGLEASDQHVKVQLWSDKPVLPMDELKEALGQEPNMAAWREESLTQLKQSLTQPEASFVPHRLSPGMVLLISQLMLDWNGGRLSLWEGGAQGTAVDAASVSEGKTLSEGKTEGSGVEIEASAAQQGRGLELCLPIA